MHRYVLVVEIDERSLRVLRRGGSRIVVAKAAGQAAPSTVWLARPPSLRTAISWQETYGLYAAEIPPRSGASIRIACSAYPAHERKLYAFLGRVFADPVDTPWVPRGHFLVRNDARHPAAFGLLQQAHVNGERFRAPVNAVVVPPALRADFVAFETVHVWLQHGTVHSGSIAPPRTPSYAVVFARDQPVQHLRYDPWTATFVAAEEQRPRTPPTSKG